MPQQVRPVQDRTDGYTCPRESHKEKRPTPSSHLAEDYIRRTVQDVAEENRLLIGFEANALAQTIANVTADQQANAGCSPKLSQALSAAIEHEFTEESE